MGSATLYFTSFVVCFASGFIPLVNAELYILSATALATGGQHVGIVLLGTAGQMAAKTAIFLGVRSALKFPRLQASERLARTRGWLELRRRFMAGAVFMSAAAGIPPFYLVSAVAGAAGCRLTTFLVAGFAGRFLRFLLVAEVPSAVAWLVR
jgi:membrane protein YqaA with SNARE-associated domain